MSWNGGEEEEERRRRRREGEGKEREGRRGRRRRGEGEEEEGEGEEEEELRSKETKSKVERGWGDKRAYCSFNRGRLGGGGESISYSLPSCSPERTSPCLCMTACLVNYGTLVHHYGSDIT